jgi:hypothetical protein
MGGTSWEQKNTKKTKKVTFFGKWPFPPRGQKKRGKKMTFFIRKVKKHEKTPKQVSSVNRKKRPRKTSIGDIGDGARELFPEKVTFPCFRKNTFF